MDKNVYVDELKQMDGLEVSGMFAVAKKDTIKEYRSGYFFTLTLADRTGRIEAKFWGGQDREAVEEVYSRISTGDVIWVEGIVRSFRDTPQLNVSLDGGNLSTVPPGEYDIRDFMDVCPRDRAEMLDELKEIVSTVKDDDYRRILESFLSRKDLVEAFSETPASKVFHHSYIGGLLEHTLGVLRIAVLAADLYEGVDRDLLITAAALHDIGKIREYRYGALVDYTPEGTLLGQTYLSQALVSEITEGAGGVPEEKKIKLIHLILSHHGEIEYGAFMRPKLPEGVILQYADALDAKLKAFLEVKEEHMETEEDFVYVPRRDINRSIYLR